MVSLKGLIKVRMIGGLAESKCVTKKVSRSDKQVTISKLIPYQCSLEVLFNNTKEMKIYRGNLDIRLNRGDSLKLMLINSSNKNKGLFKELDAIIEINGVTRLTTNFMKCGIN